MRLDAAGKMLWTKCKFINGKKEKFDANAVGRFLNDDLVIVQ